MHHKFSQFFLLSFIIIALIFGPRAVFAHQHTSQKHPCSSNQTSIPINIPHSCALHCLSLVKNETKTTVETKTVSPLLENVLLITEPIIFPINLTKKINTIFLKSNVFRDTDPLLTIIKRE
ncbi:hypothetical protein CO172_01510 [Candidatus Uhrbacteria bacterium CG_4_9_14_3_um_filter_36_7]|uniref:Uncharacterized protein n=1 Tax=Candidatus Uhrbacteria bacterium CG_4_9_14_3_um_filter_36_7 TaxID=1975033 RepID=A0A2M7XHU0_9BACT|nr:MAG: hypothetical protein CO172_01510 [Candidatus Uhrbacteria bacterium CG_4_9_14_3_um_filter_36_7]